MVPRKTVFLSLSACAVALAVLWLAVLAQAQASPSLPAVPEVAIAPQAGRSTAPLNGALPDLRSSATSHAGPAAQKPILLSSPSLVQPAAGPYYSPGPVQTAPGRAAALTVRPPAGEPVDLLNRRPGGELARAGLRPGAPGVTGLSTMSGVISLSATPVITFNVTYGQVTGYTDASSDVHLLLRRGGALAGEARMRSDAVGYFYAELMSDGRWATAQPGDTLDVVVNGVTTTLEVPALTGVVDVDADTVAGTIGGVPLPAGLRVSCWGNRLAVTSDGAGNYLADLSGLTDITWVDGVGISLQDGNGNWLEANFFAQDGLLIAPTWASVYGLTDPGAVVTVTVNHGGDLTMYTDQADPRDGWWSVGFDAISMGDVVSAEVGIATVVDTVAGLGAEFDLVNDQISGTGPASSQVSVFSCRRQGLHWWCPTRRAATDSGGQFIADFPEGLDTWTSAYVVHHDTAQADTLIWVPAPLAEVEWPGNNVWGYAHLGAEITATLSDGSAPIEQVTATADWYSGYYWAYFDTPFQPGQQMTVQGGGLNVAIDLETVTANLDADSEALYGQAPPNTALWATVGSYFGPYFQNYTAADGSGAYLVDLSAVKDVHNEANAYAEVPQGDDVDQAGWQMDYGVTPYLDLNETHNGVWGRVSQEGTVVTLTLKTGGGMTKGSAEAQSNSYGDFDWQQFYDEYGNVLDIEPGDQVEVQVDGWSQTAVAPSIAVNVDADMDRVSGTGPADSFLEVYVRDYWPPLRVPTGGDGNFLADFTGLVDIKAKHEVEVGQHDANWNRRIVVGTPPHVFFRANAFGDWVDGSTSPDATVWISATDGYGTLKGTRTTTAKSDGWFDGVDLWLDGQRTDLLPGDVIYVASSDGTEASGTLITIEGQLNVEGDFASGQMSGGAFPAKGNVSLWQRSTGQWFGWDLAVEADGSFTLDLSDQVDVQGGDYAEVWYFDADGNWLGTLFFTPYLQANVQRTHNWVNGEASPFVTVTVVISDSTGAYKGGGQSWTGGGTWFQVNPQWPDGSSMDIVTGDTVFVSAPGISATLPVIGLEAAVDAVGDVISGHLPDAVSYPADLDVEVWDTPMGYSQRVQTDGSGDFSVDLTGGYDVRIGEQIAVWYVRPDGHRVGIVCSELRLYPNVTDDWVGEATAPNTYVEVTVSDGELSRAVKGTASGWSDGEEGYFGLEPRLDGERTDILPGDLVEATAGGRSASITIPEPFSSDYDYVANTISGQAPASSTLQVWIDNYPSFWITVPESGEWSVDFSPYGDPQIWEQGYVNYYSEEGHVAQLRCRIPLPDLRVEKWVEGNNQAAPGGPSVFTLRYGNDGSTDTEAIVLTDTLPADTAYVTDTSGVTPDTGPGWVRWTLPSLAPGEERQFQLVLANSAEPGTTLRNQADVWAKDDYNTGNNHAEAEVSVIEEQPDLYANKKPNPSDPSPGQTFLWEIDYGNNRPVPAGPVVLTDTFPTSTTLVSWYSANGYDLWQEEEAGDRLVLSAPAIPGWWGDQIILQLRVKPDVDWGTQLSNRIEISAPDDANPDDNWRENDAWVSPPRWDAGIYKDFNWGQLVAGGQAVYSIHFRNHGNMPAAVTLTDTLPAGAHFAEAWASVGPDYVPFPPAYFDDEIAVWEVDAMEPGAWINLDLYLTVDDDISPDTDLTNCMAIAMEGDGHPFNDTSCVTDAVREPGPNLRLHKMVWWNGQDRLEYEIRMENVGTEELDNFEITDIYPEGTAWNDDWWVKWGPGMTVTHDAPSRQLVFGVDDLGPGGTGGIGFRVDLDGNLVGEQGLAFTNTAQVPITDDVYPADNEAVVTAYTGPDLFAEKWSSGGRPRPGEVLTFTVRTGNANQGPWEMSDGTELILIERLPADMTFITATWPDGSPVEPFFYDPGSGLVMFNFGRMGSEDWRWFFLAVQLDADLRGGDVLLNRLEVQQLPAVDSDPIPGNNSYEYEVTVEGNRIFLPAVLRNY